MPSDAYGFGSKKAIGEVCAFSNLRWLVKKATSHLRVSDTFGVL
jgi:hypothetical protein